jgi:hypothetical protein
MDRIASSFKLFSNNSSESSSVVVGPWNRVSESIAELFSVRNIPGAIMVFCLILLYLLRERLSEIVSEYMYDPLYQLFGKAWLNMHLSSSGEYMSTYIHESDAFTGLSDMLSGDDIRTSDVLETIAPF